MCHFLYVASPLTLSEVRSMLPAGLTADLLPPAEARKLLSLLPAARTAARLLAGPCSCDLYARRDPDPLVDERDLRRRFRDLRVSRQQVIESLARHRRGAAGGAGPEQWGPAIAEFVAEHARNAGPTLYFRHVTPTGLAARPPHAAAVERSVPQVRADPQGWLAEDQPTIVVRAG